MPVIVVLWDDRDWLVGRSEGAMATTLRWTSADLEGLPDDGKRYEILDGELHVSKQPHWDHQFVCGLIFALLQEWSRRTRSGMPNIAPGVIFADDDDAVPDVVWISYGRLATALEEDGKLHAAPELAVEVLRLENRMSDATGRPNSRPIPDAACRNIGLWTGEGDRLSSTAVMRQHYSLSRR